ncbi:hypothetical protein [Caballeronia sp. 15711]|uniref:hypothetical protein n=1 Tax=Caballeronia sp. 15711 TaxID=3391029 RepID=UPI0039E49E83
MKTLGRQIEQLGEAPFLHVFSDNRSAIGCMNVWASNCAARFTLPASGMLFRGRLPFFRSLN